MIVLVDTNVVLDVLLDRAPHADAAARLLAAIEDHRLTGLLGATTVTTLHYIAARTLGERRARRHITTLLSLFEIAPVTGDVLRDATSLGWADFEDAVLHESARAAGADAIVTRDRKGFARAKLRTYTPAELLALLSLDTA